MRNTKLYRKVEESGVATTEQLDQIFEPLSIYNAVEHSCSSVEKAILKSHTDKLTARIRNFGEKSAHELLVKMAIAIAEADQKRA